MLFRAWTKLVKTPSLEGLFVLAKVTRQKLIGGHKTMCGIVGYNGELDAKEILLKGLEKLEYRGYDSAGIAVHNEEGVTIFKEKGRIADLRQAVDADVEAAVGIGLI